MEESLFYLKKFDHTSGSKVIATYTLQKDHEIFKGHFPQRPVLPGVSQLLLVRRTLSQIFNTEFKLKKAREMKFPNMMLPEHNDTLEMELQYTMEGEVLKVQGKLYFKEYVFMKIKADFESMVH